MKFLCNTFCRLGIFPFGGPITYFINFATSCENKYFIKLLFVYFRSRKIKKFVCAARFHFPSFHFYIIFNYECYNDEGRLVRTHYFLSVLTLYVNELKIITFITKGDLGNYERSCIVPEVLEYPPVFKQTLSIMDTKRKENLVSLRVKNVKHCRHSY